MSPFEIRPMFKDWNAQSGVLLLMTQFVGQNSRTEFIYFVSQKRSSFLYVWQYYQLQISSHTLKLNRPNSFSVVTKTVVEGNCASYAWQSENCELKYISESLNNDTRYNSLASCIPWKELFQCKPRFLLIFIINVIDSKNRTTSFSYLLLSGTFTKHQQLNLWSSNRCSIFFSIFPTFSTGLF